jgi:hypothetical protein
MNTNSAKHEYIWKLTNLIEIVRGLVESASPADKSGYRPDLISDHDQFHRRRYIPSRCLSNIVDTGANSCDTRCWRHYAAHSAARQGVDEQIQKRIPNGVTSESRSRNSRPILNPILMLDKAGFSESLCSTKWEQVMCAAKCRYSSRPETIDFSSGSSISVRPCSYLCPIGMQNESLPTPSQ